MEWTKNDLGCTLHIDLNTNRTVIDYVDTEEGWVFCSRCKEGPIRLLVNLNDQRMVCS